MGKPNAFSAFLHEYYINNRHRYHSKQAAQKDAGEAYKTLTAAEQARLDQM